MTLQQNQLKEFNKLIRAWTRATTVKLAISTPLDTSQLGASVKGSTMSKLGQVEKAAFSFLAYGIYAAKGVGRGVPISKAGTAFTKRKPQEWYNPVLEKEVNKLADEITEVFGDEVLESIKIVK